MSTDTIVNLDAIVEKWAREEYEKDAKSIRDLKKYLKDLEMLTKVPRRSNITFKKQGETKFTKGEKEDAQEGDNNIPNAVNKIVFKSTYNNNTGYDQNHAFKTERTITVNEKTAMTNGFKMGMNFGIQLGVPRVANTTLHINPEVSLSNSTETSKTHTLTWTSDSTLPVPKRHRVIAEVVVKEEEYTGLFESCIAINGLMEVDFIDPKSNSIIHTVRDDIARIINKCQPLAIREDVKLSGDTTVIWTVRGTCHFQYDIKQTINTRCEELPKEYPGPYDSD
ncbi:uncharacterized protein LOC110462091 [Mizuhopecten yessoensis]|uniref:Uncharacterized protein n=1 Tax=Mizuhopecten yessoensis TaxID=6573 RepID=A0A210PYV9_MIZYE|nr:uncharacterized protein LOC110462091 [Mizuhopecten yessoensis]OWF41677.1 hypothetical protein KP79_PYT18593 [Mizuhopecten yessoensis]